MRSRVDALLSSCLTLAGLAGAIAGCGRRGIPDGLAAKSGIPTPTAAPASANDERKGRGVCDAAAPTQTVTFVHVNDLHAHYHPPSDDPKRQSPYARLRGYFEQVRKETPYALFTNAGDDFEKGSVAELLSSGVATVEVTHAMKFDVRVLGNHDFAWGEGIVARSAADPHALVLASNLMREGGGFPTKEYATMRVGCLDIGFIGLLTQPFDEHDKSFAGDYLPKLRSDHDVVGRARALVEKHRQEVQLMVVVSHLGKDADKGVARDVPGIDVILGGHSHDEFDAVETVEGRTAIIQAGHDARHLARLDVRFDKAARKVSRVDYRLVQNDGALPVDAEVQRAVEQIQARWAPKAHEPLGTVSTMLKRREAAVLAARAAIVKLHADGAFVRDTVVAEGESIPQGPLDQQRIATAYPVQREPPNTPGFTSFYTADVSVGELGKMLDKLPDDLRWEGPKLATLKGRRSVRIALPKALALGSDPAPGGVKLGNPSPGCEAWEAVEAYARSRQAVCQPIDKDAPIAGCVPTRN